MSDDLETVKEYLAKQSENLAENMMQDVESDAQEYTQELIHSIQVKGGTWIDIKMGSLELAFGDAEMGEVLWEAELMTGEFESGSLSDIIGFKSLG